MNDQLTYTVSDACDLPIVEEDYLSSLIVPIAHIDDVKPHPNADKLEIAQVLGWQVVVQKDTYEVGQTVTYFPPDTVLPVDVSDSLGVTKYLSNGRVRQVRLRGEPSFGFIGPATAGFDVGANVADIYGATKYEPPVRGNVGDYLPDNALFPAYTDIENMRNFPDVLQPGETVVITEKLHGTNVRVGIVEGERMAGSKRLRRGMPTGPLSQSMYWYPWSMPQVEGLLMHLAETHRQVVLYGEVFGSTVFSSHNYGFKGRVGFRAFDLLLDGRYVDTGDVDRLCQSFDVPTVPRLSTEPFSLDVVRALSGGRTALMDDNAHMREGVVVRPMVERTDPRVGRVILKYVSDQFLFGTTEDTTEV